MPIMVNTIKIVNKIYKSNEKTTYVQDSAAE